MSNEVKLNTKKILTLRTSNCWSQEELASASGLSVRTIQRVEKSGVASLETTKALSSVFGVTPLELQTVSTFENMSLGFIIKYAWLVAFALSSVFFGLWIVDILIPTLKGANFDQQYELHGNFRYLDFGGLSFFAGFLLLVINVSWEHTSKKRLIGASRSQA
ncbi:helix-turn-helix domain-containing protein [Alteromonas sp. McT4-15]|jgi:transcriptional regulator with XRE-family HTH domain|uniref:helix-turn-helix domain-containing protein n=1 Tax=Alteromonas sp. McT4-15 TaxID=2881256 RepID=UPI001CF81E64|nr:helix-turn-helix transcriptional regulator [Alteromonas sp. McT4-15]MCB4437220.1 helix-turn-helix domain-containing protein [Alteromonas sp. McT4-15]